MKKVHNNREGISETVSVILVIALVLVLAMVIYAMLFGSVDSRYMKKTVYIAGTAEMTGISRLSGIPDYVLTFSPKAGDPFFLIGQTQGRTGTGVTVKLFSPDGKTLYPHPDNLSGPLYGKQLFIYQNRSSGSVCDYTISDRVPTDNLPKMTIGHWKIQLIDEEVHVLANTFEADITKGTTSSPVVGGTAGLTAGFFRSDCTPLPQSITGSLPTSGSGGPGNMTYTHFNGASYTTIPNDPTLTFTGDMTLSLWMRPDTSGSGTNSWHTVIGKGQILNGVEDDNYQLVTIGNDLYFEWNDPNGQHYHVSTTGFNPLQNNQWTYTTVVVNGGTSGGVSIYNNGKLVPVQYYNNNNPYPYEGTPMTTPPVVKLKQNNLDAHVGVQADPGNPFYFKGDIGNIAVYNRALQKEEITANNAMNQA